MAVKKFGDVHANYVGAPYDQLWIEKGHYTSYSGEIDFHGEREIPIDKEISVLLKTAAACVEEDLDLTYGRITIENKYVPEFVSWLNEQRDPIGTGLTTIAGIIDDDRGYWGV